MFIKGDCVSLCRQQSEEGEKNGSEDDDEEKPGKRVMGPRKKFVWDDKLRSVSQRNQVHSSFFLPASMFNCLRLWSLTSTVCFPGRCCVTWCG